MNPEATRWLKQSAEDLETAQILLESNRYGPCAFFCQQSAEKALKAAIYNAEERPWGHSVPSLLDQACAVLQIELDSAPLPEVEELDEHYIRPRYPDARLDIEADYSRETAETALHCARAVQAFVVENLGHA
jgi:HEPN domain-containing protein